MTGPICLIFGRRSGTSSLAKSLYETGYPLRGPLDTRHFPAQPEGHYENILARNINQGILEHYNIKPGTPGLVPFQVCPALRLWADKPPEAFIVKDPGLDLTWPVWVRTLPQGRLRGIWCQRDPEERIESLVKRYNIPPDNAKWAVTMYDLCVEAATHHIMTLKVDLYDPARVKRAETWLSTNNIYPGPIPDPIRQAEETEPCLP